MSEQPTPPEPREPSVTQNVSGGVTVQPGGDANVGGDVVGRDKVQTTTTVTNVGMTPEAVRRLVHHRRRPGVCHGVLLFLWRHRGRRCGASSLCPATPLDAWLRRKTFRPA